MAERGLDLGGLAVPDLGADVHRRQRLGIPLLDG
jgi:hypothetical protein